jgi:hypothetical protein
MIKATESQNPSGDLRAALTVNSFDRVTRRDDRLVEEASGLQIIPEAGHKKRISRTWETWQSNANVLAVTVETVHRYI